jgi:hypothetical protein
MCHGIIKTWPACQLMNSIILPPLAAAAAAKNAFCYEENSNCDDLF